MKCKPRKTSPGEFIIFWWACVDWNSGGNQSSFLMIIQFHQRNKWSGRERERGESGLVRSSDVACVRVAAAEDLKTNCCFFACCVFTEIAILDVSSGSRSHQLERVLAALNAQIITYYVNIVN